MFKRISSGALLVALALLMTAGSAAAAMPGPAPGHSHDDPYPSPKGLVLAGSHGYEVIVAALPAERGSHAEARVRSSVRLLTSLTRSTRTSPAKASTPTSAALGG
jgi:hypothetical protein